jgi:uncharacterized membrane protein HdeD (DUF308 family)
MTTTHWVPFLLGAAATASGVVAVFFARYYRDTRDPLFLCFSVAFMLEAVNRVVLMHDDTPNEASPVLYLLRAFSYAIIAAGIIWKNR